MSRQINSTAKLSGLLSGYIFSFPLAMGIIGKSFIIADFFMLLLIAAKSCKNVIEKQFRLSSLDALLLLFLALSLIGKNVWLHPSAYFFELFSLLLLYCGSSIIAAEIGEEEKLQKFLIYFSTMFRTVIIFSSLIIVLKQMNFHEISAPFFSVHDNFKGLFNFTNQMAIFIICLWPLAIVEYSENPLRRYFFYGALFLTMASVASRSGFWIVILQAIMVEIFLPRTNRKWSLTISALALLSVLSITITFLGTDTGLQRSLGHLEHAPLTVDEPRMKNFREAFNSASSWIRGYGLGCFDQTHVHEVHNTPFSILVETGVPGLITAGFFIILILISFLKSKPLPANAVLKKALMISWAGIVSVSMFHYLLRNRSCWIILAITIALTRQDKNANASHE